MSFENIREEELKNKIAQVYFEMFDCTQIIGNVDFCVSASETQSLLWAEAKKGKADILKSIVQLILTIGKARSFDKSLPPAFLGAFDSEKIAFIPYNDVQEIFYQNDFNWNVTPSNYETKEFGIVLEKVRATIEENSLLFFFGKDDQEIHFFVRNNFILGKSHTSKIQIDKNNFIIIYNKWLQTVKPTITIDWEIAKKYGIIDGDFYLADLLSAENETLKEKLYVLLRKDHYELDRKLDEMGMFSSRSTGFNDKQKAHQQFWNKYQRPPREEYWDYIVERRDLLVPQDVRERKGSFFTPQIWVELSQKYLTDVLGEDWQDEYYIWDCAAGTGNLLAGLTNKYHIWASTLDRQDVDVMKDRIRNGANLLEKHIFQFDFLNDDFSKLPNELQNVINDPEKRKKLVIYINPPYAEASNKKTLKGGIEGNKGVEQSKTNKKYAALLGQGNAELFAQFLTRIYFEIPDCFIAQFSTLKIIQGQHFISFRNFFKAKIKKSFICPANTFDNVNGNFPIGFMIWETKTKVVIKKLKAQVFDKTANKLVDKNFQSYDQSQYINDWVKPYRADPKNNHLIGKFPFKGNDFQNQGMIQIVHYNRAYNTEAGQFLINQKNVLIASVYFAVRKCINTNWIINGDQFLHPNKKWEKDYEFQHDCLAYTLFNVKIQLQHGTNHWIPFTEQEVGAKEKFESDFMSKYIKGKIDTNITSDLFSKVDKKKEKPLEFSAEAKAVFAAGLALWRYYHAQADSNPNASLYDIREYFQGRNEKGRMKPNSEDEIYAKLIADLRSTLDLLARKIEPKVYEYGFLRE